MDGAPSFDGDTGGGPDDESKLLAKIHQLTNQLSKLRAENANLQSERDQLSAEIANMKLGETFEPAPENPEGEEPAAVSDEAARKRLWRLCKRGADGTLSHNV